MAVQKTANLYYYNDKYECFKRGITSTLTLYNRDNTKAHSCVAFEPAVKKFIKSLGFKWDKSNHSYYLENPTPDVVEAVAQVFALKTTDHRTEAAK